MSQWQPIETAPKDGTWLLLWWPYWRPFVPVIGFCINGKRWHAEESLSSWSRPDPLDAPTRATEGRREVTPCIVCEVVLMAESGQMCFTCKNREQERAKKRRHYSEISRMKCRHCHKNKRNCSRGLCSTCYRNPCISKYYAVKESPNLEKNPPLPVRQKGDAPERCLHCLKWKCALRKAGAPMPICGECQEKMSRLLARLPAGLEEDVA